MKRTSACALTSPLVLERACLELLTSPRRKGSTLSGTAGAHKVPAGLVDLVRLALADAGLFGRGNALHGDEVRELKKIFGDSIDYALVRVSDDLPRLAARTDLGLTLGNTIYLSSSRRDGPTALVHEMTHVWQYQNGGAGYLTTAILGRGLSATDSQDGDAHVQWLSQKGPWTTLGAEEQATLLAAVFNDSGLEASSGLELKSYLADAVRSIHDGRGAP